MNLKLLFILAATVLLGAFAQASDDDLDDDVTVETEEPEEEEDVIQYKSPTPNDRFYFAEHFDNAAEYAKKWIRSEAMKEGIDADIAKYDGEWALEAPQRDKLQGDFGLVLKSKAKHAAIASHFSRPFVFDAKPLIVQYEVTLQDGQECGGAYIKLLSEGKGLKELNKFQDKTPYTIMFGPDKCGNDHKLHFIFRHRNPLNDSFEEKHCKKPKERLEEAFKDKMPHLYTLILRPDNTFEVKLDHKVINDGNLFDDFTPSVNPPEEIDDPNDSKPEDWDEREKIPDPEAVKPEDWDESEPAQIPDETAVKPEAWLEDEPELIPDPTAVKPDDWDSEMDGDWEAPLIPNPSCEQAPGCGEWKPPMIANPAYKGKWHPPQIANPNYKGKWKPRRIPNPYFFEDKNPFKMTTIAAVGIELWSMSKDILFDNIIVTDDLEAAEQWAAETYALKRRKIDKDSDTMWTKVMKQINYSPGYWSLYFVYCSIPVIGYGWYLAKRVREESFLTRVMRFTHQNPWVWAVYVLVFGLPVVLVLFFCCTSGSSSAEKEEMKRAAEAKKTDSVTQDDPIDEATAEEIAADTTERVPAQSKSTLEEDGDVDTGDIDNEASVPTQGEEAAGDMPRKRKVRKD